MMKADRKNLSGLWGSITVLFDGLNDIAEKS